MKQRRILVVDDSVDAAESLARMLGLMGHDVRTAHDGPGALEAAGTFGPDVVLLDIGLPKLDGFQVAQWLRGRLGFTDIVVVALTGFAADKYRALAEEVGFDHFLVKPVDPEELRALLRRFQLMIASVEAPARLTV